MDLGWGEAGGVCARGGNGVGALCEEEIRGVGRGGGDG